MNAPVLVLNASYEPINVCSTRRAVILTLKGVARVEEQSPHMLRSSSMVMPAPSVIRLLEYIHIPYERKSLSRKNILLRDHNTCQYCARISSPGELTLDHVVPRSRGGRSSWDNVVTSCAPCNLRKGDRLPSEIGMHPRSRPRAPRPDVFISVAAPRQPKSWQPYLAPA